MSKELYATFINVGAHRNHCLHLVFSGSRFEEMKIADRKSGFNEGSVQVLYSTSNSRNSKKERGLIPNPLSNERDYNGCFPMSFYLPPFVDEVKVKLPCDIG